jgi:ADP-ribose pyrophosphatase YjhB (NUDIX family)
VNPSHCSSCGAPFLTAERTQPHPHCTVCDVTNWQNARPVVVFLQPVLVSGGLGVAVARRGIVPDKGVFVLPGGFLEKGETSTQAAAREFGEEAGVTGLARAASCRLIGDLPSSSKQHQLLFVVNTASLAQQDFDKLRDTDEMYDWSIRTREDGPALGWSTHEAVVARWLSLTSGTSMMRNEEVFGAEFVASLGF